jgi:hypothetical protein
MPRLRYAAHCAAALSAAALAACRGGGPTDTVVARATIGPDGGELRVADGPFAGIALTVPPGALAAPVELRIVRLGDPKHAFIDPLALRLDPSFQAAEPLRVEPLAQEFTSPARLLLRYEPLRIDFTAPGNVRVRHASARGDQRIEPDRVDVDAGEVEIDVGICGTFGVVNGPVQQSLQAYVGDPGSVPLDGGVQFARQFAADPVHHPNRNVERWTITAPSGVTGLDFDDFMLLGRFSVAAPGLLPLSWLEVLRDPLLAWRHVSVLSIPGTPPSTATDIWSPMQATSPLGSGTLALEGHWRYASPMQVGSRCLLDLVELQMNAHWNRPDIGEGQQQQTFVFAPGFGLVALQVDGVLHLRTDL